MKNVFYFIWKALFVIKIFKVLSQLFNHVEKNGLIRNITLITKFMTSQPGWQTTTVQILPNISESKGSQTMKFCQLMEYKKRIIFSKNHAENKAGRPAPDFFVFSKIFVWGGSSLPAA